MALQDTSNLHLYKAQASIATKYAPLVQRGKFLHQQESKSTFAEKQKAGYTNIDLWCDGSIYPIDPRSRKRPKFNSLKGLLEFVGDGEDGLFGYLKSIEGQSFSLSQYLAEIALLKECIICL